MVVEAKLMWRRIIILFGLIGVLASCQGSPALPESAETTNPAAVVPSASGADAAVSAPWVGPEAASGADAAVSAPWAGPKAAPGSGPAAAPPIGAAAAAKNGPGPIKAVYFAPKDGAEIDAADLRRHPEVKVVHHFDDLKEASGQGIAIWIDKDVADQVDRDWLDASPQISVPIVVVGYHDTLYAFRETLGAFYIEGPRVDWSKQRVAPGFSVWMWKEYTPRTKSAWHRGYDQTAAVRDILAVTDALLAGNVPPLEEDALPSGADSFGPDQAMALVLQDHAEYPRAGETRDIEIMTGGPPPGSKVKGTLTSKVEPSSEPDTYIVTLTKRWDLIFNGKELVGHWKYKVAPDAVQLIESEDNTDLVGMVK